MSQRTIQFGWDDEGEPLTWPAHYVICPRCKGEGKHVHSGIDGNGITASEMHEMGDEFREDYCSGVYDVACDECHGERAILEVALNEMELPERGAYYKAERDVWESQAVDRSEARAFGY